MGIARGEVGQAYKHMLIYTFFEFLTCSFLSAITMVASECLELAVSQQVLHAFSTYVVHNQNLNYIGTSSFS